MERIKPLTTKAIIDCLLRLDEFEQLPTAIKIAFKKQVIIEYQGRATSAKIMKLSPEEQGFLKEHSAKYMPAIMLNLEEAVNTWIVEHEQIRRTRKNIGRITDDYLLSYFVKLSYINCLKDILPTPLNA